MRQCQKSYRQNHGNFKWSPVLCFKWFFRKRFLKAHRLLNWGFHTCTRLNYLRLTSFLVSHLKNIMNGIHLRIEVHQIIKIPFRCVALACAQSFDSIREKMAAARSWNQMCLFHHWHKAMWFLKLHMSNFVEHNGLIRSNFFDWAMKKNPLNQELKIQCLIV